MNLDQEITNEALARGRMAAVIDAKTCQTLAGFRARMQRVFAPGLAAKIVTHRLFLRDPETQEITGSRDVPRNAMQDEVDELGGYVFVLANWIDEMVRKGQITIPDLPVE